jgi:hypothetical protein
LIPIPAHEPRESAQWLRQPLEHELGIEPAHTVPEARKHAIPPRVRGTAPGVILAVDFHDQPRGGRDDVGNEAEPAFPIARARGRPQARAQAARQDAVSLAIT